MIRYGTIFQNFVSDVDDLVPFPPSTYLWDYHGRVEYAKAGHGSGEVCWDKAVENSSGTGSVTIFYSFLELLDIFVTFINSLLV